MNDVTEEVDGITFVPGAEERGCNLMKLCVRLSCKPEWALPCVYLCLVNGCREEDVERGLGRSRLSYVSEGMNQDLQGVYVRCDG